MQEGTSSSKQSVVPIAEHQSGDQEENIDLLNSKYSLTGRRNALTPESHHIEPIRQAEIQEKLSFMSMANENNDENNNITKKQTGCSKETLEHVPTELQRNFTLMADLDKRGGELVKRINECVKDYRKCDKKEERNSLFKESMDLFDKARAYADDKIDLAMQTYDLVDKHIRRLESLSGAQATSEINGAQGKTNKSHKGGQADNGSSTGFGGSGGSGAFSGSISTEPLAVDMPLDPNEPKYCTCHQVSFGEMIACDNKDCPIEWFHFACVELKSKPKGKWYCPECFNINKKGKHRSFKRQRT